MICYCFLKFFVFSSSFIVLMLNASSILSVMYIVWSCSWLFAVSMFIPDGTSWSKTSVGLMLYFLNISSFTDTHIAGFCLLWYSWTISSIYSDLMYGRSATIVIISSFSSTYWLVRMSARSSMYPLACVSIIVIG